MNGVAYLGYLMATHPQANFNWLTWELTIYFLIMVIWLMTFSRWLYYRTAVMKILCRKSKS